MKIHWTMSVIVLSIAVAPALGQPDRLPPLSGPAATPSPLAPMAPAQPGASASPLTPSPAAPTATTAGAPSTAFSPCEGLTCCSQQDDPRFWASAETLLWWFKSAPLPPTLTTFAPGSPSATTGFGGALGVPGTIVLSPSNMSYPMTVGGRFTLGGWIDSNYWYGAEVVGFFLGTQTSNFTAGSGGSPSLRVPFVNVPPGAGFPIGESSFVLADPGFAAGGQTIHQTLNLWGLEKNALFHLMNNDRVDMSFLAGFRYMELSEDLSISSSERLLGPGPTFAYQGYDNFGTRNQFYGGQIGLKARTQFGRFDVLGIAKLALGDDRETESVRGNSTSVSTVPGLVSGTTPGGIFAQSTNSGSRTHNSFCVIPEVQLQLGYNFTKRLRGFVGYNFIYMSSVIRPGEQIDRTLNFTSNAAISGVLPPALMGAPRPEPLFNQTSFWVQGINLGAEFKF